MSRKKKDLIIIQIITIIGIIGSIIITITSTINQKGIITILVMEEKGVIQGKIVIKEEVIIEVKAKVKVIVINIILNIAKINIEIINMIQIVEQKNIYQTKENHIHHLIQNQTHLPVLLVPINLPYYIPIQ